MSTLARDFGAEHPGGRAEWLRAHLAHWLANHVPPDEQVQAESDIRRAIEEDPQLTEWAAWPWIRVRGKWLREIDGDAGGTGEPYSPIQPKIANRCPACGARSLFIGAGGFLTCSVIGCHDPGLAGELLDSAAEDQ